jgi:hypothetical protein
MKNMMIIPFISAKNLICLDTGRDIFAFHKVVCIKANGVEEILMGLEYSITPTGRKPMRENGKMGNSTAMGLYTMNKIKIRYFSNNNYNNLKNRNQRQKIKTRLVTIFY